mmetsp:Transcript_22724/g.52391  ORF Transcript_22724/g.52391 Transcript_22724/m.52391 type:complete len:298 (+) Transcript_22724:364-1257(+)
MCPVGNSHATVPKLPRYPYRSAGKRREVEVGCHVRSSDARHDESCRRHVHRAHGRLPGRVRIILQIPRRYVEHPLVHVRVPGNVQVDALFVKEVRELWTEDSRLHFAVLELCRAVERSVPENNDPRMCAPIGVGPCQVALQPCQLASHQLRRIDEEHLGGDSDKMDEASVEGVPPAVGRLTKLLPEDGSGVCRHVPEPLGVLVEAVVRLVVPRRHHVRDLGGDRLDVVQKRVPVPPHVPEEIVCNVPRVNHQVNSLPLDVRFETGYRLPHHRHPEVRENRKRNLAICRRRFEVEDSR